MQTVAQDFTDNLITLHGPPIAIASDKERIFTSKLWKEIFIALIIKPHYGSAYHPNSDGLTERVNQCIENYLSCMVSTQSKWVTHIPMVVYWYNSCYHSSLHKNSFWSIVWIPTSSNQWVYNPWQCCSRVPDWQQQLLTPLKEISTKHNKEWRSLLTKKEWKEHSKWETWFIWRCSHIA